VQNPLATECGEDKEEKATVFKVDDEYYAIFFLVDAEGNVLQAGGASTTDLPPCIFPLDSSALVSLKKEGRPHLCAGGCHTVLARQSPSDLDLTEIFIS